jgi:hypothetical protein
MVEVRRKDIPRELFLIDARTPVIPMKFVDSGGHRPFHSLCKLGESLPSLGLCTMGPGISGFPEKAFLKGSERSMKPIIVPRYRFFSIPSAWVSIVLSLRSSIGSDSRVPLAPPKFLIVDRPTQPSPQ